MCSVSLFTLHIDYTTGTEKILQYFVNHLLTVVHNFPILNKGRVNILETFQPQGVHISCSHFRKEMFITRSQNLPTFGNQVVNNLFTFCLQKIYNLFTNCKHASLRAYAKRRKVVKGGRVFWEKIFFKKNFFFCLTPKLPKRILNSEKRKTKIFPSPYFL